MANVSMDKGTMGTMKDPKQLLDEEIDEAFAAEQVVITVPKSPRFQWLQGWISPRGLLTVIAVAVSFSLVGTIISRTAARRKWTLGRALSGRADFRRTGFSRARGGRRVGYERYRLGRFGQAVVAYTYKVPEVHVHLPQMTYKIPAIRVKVPTITR